MSASTVIPDRLTFGMVISGAIGFNEQTFGAE
jgi:hypothetical protein